MKKTIMFLILFLFTFLLVYKPFTVSAVDDDYQVAKVVSIPSNEVIEKDMYTAAGEIVELSGVFKGDVYAVGGQVLIDGIVEGDLLVAGGTVTVSGNVKQDLRVAGGQVNISGTVGRNVTAAGGNVEINDRANVAGALLIMGGNVSVLSPIGGDVTAAAGNLLIADNVSGNIEAYVGNLRLSSKANVGGNLVYMSEADALLDSNSTVSGETIRKIPPKEFVPGNKEFKAEDFSKIFGRMRYLFTLFGFLPSLLVGLLCLKFFPIYMKVSAESIKNELLKSMLAGVSAFVILPALIFLLVITLVGIPISTFIALMMPIYLYLAKLPVAYLFGREISAKIKPGMGIYSQFLVGLISYYLLLLLPIINNFVMLFGTIIGVGALLLADLAVYKNISKKGLV